MNAHTASPPTTNRIPDDREVLLKHHLARIQDSAEALAEARQEHNHRRKLAKADGFNLADEIDFGLSIQNAQEDETVAASLRRRLQTASFLNLAVGYQGNLFDAPTPADADARAFDAGLDAGITGKDPEAPDGYDPTRWMEGWHKGQERLREAMQARMEEANAKAEPSEPKKRGRPPGSKNKKAEAAENTSGTGADPFTKH